MTRRILVGLAFAAISLLCLATAAAAAPVMRIASVANTTVAPGGHLSYFVTVTNVGDESTNGEMTLKVSLPSGLTVLRASTTPEEIWDCTNLLADGTVGTCVDTGSTQDPREQADPTKSRSSRLFVEVGAEGAADETLMSHFELFGGGAVRADGTSCAEIPPGVACASTVDPTKVSETPFGFGIDAFDQQVSATGHDEVDTQAGGHPFSISTYVDFNTLTSPKVLLGETTPVEPAKDVDVDLPPGLIGDPQAVGVCTQAELTFSGLGLYEAAPLCPTSSQVGVVTIYANGGLGQGGSVIGEPAPVFNMVPPNGVTARFGFAVLGTTVALDAAVRSGGDYGLTVDSRNISEGVGIAGTRLTFWGLPADSSHDLERACPGTLAPGAAGPHCSSEATPEAFLRNPTSCTAPGEGLTTTLHTDSWFNPGRVTSAGSPDLSDPAWKSASITSHRAPGYPSPSSEWGPPVGIDHCENVPFAPSITVAPTTKAAESATGLRVSLSMPQQGLADPSAISEADLKAAVVRLPQGMTINPAQAKGLGACTEVQIDLHGENTEPTCPNNSKIGTVAIKTPLLGHEIEGSVYLASQTANPFHSLLALYVVGNDKEQSGTVVKLAGEVRANAQTGQLETIFTSQPQLPFEVLRLNLFGGATAPLITPAHCGTYATESRLSPWSGNPAVEGESSFQVTEGPGGSACPPRPTPFDLTFEAGTSNPTAGVYSSFLLRLARTDGSQRLAGVSVSLPQGLIGKLAGIPYCSEAALDTISGGEGTAGAQIVAPSCPAASQVGRVTVGAGAGSTPFYLQTGKAYLAGPYKGAPLSLAIVTPALAGPFDLGNVVVRAALHVDPSTTKITAESDPLPTILYGIPLDLRDVWVNLDRPEFTLNPTRCDENEIAGTATGTEGGSAQVSARFQVGDCQKLKFAPKLALKLKGPTKRTSHPRLIATLTAKPGEANIARAQVKLPKAAFLDNAHIKGICTRPAFATHSCPANSVYGKAKAVTPLLDQPLTGNVYLRANPSHKLPDLVADLNGQIEVTLAGKTDSVKGALRNTFEAVPDAPVSSFRLELFGGKRGLIEMSSGFCRSPKASVKFDAQNGKVADSEPLVGSSCKKPKRHGRDR